MTVMWKTYTSEVDQIRLISTTDKNTVVVSIKKQSKNLVENVPKTYEKNWTEKIEQWVKNGSNCRFKCFQLLVRVDS